MNGGSIYFRQWPASSSIGSRAQGGYGVQSCGQWVRGRGERLEKKNYVAMRRNKDQLRFSRFSEIILSQKKNLVIKRNKHVAGYL
jgi:hypothetical protein